MTLNLSTTEHSRDPQSPPTVKQAQTDLIRRGYSVGRWGADGQFGQATEQAVVRFQAHNGLTPDGVIGPVTWPKLNAAVPTKPVATTSAGRFYDLVAARCTGSDGHTRLAYQFGFEITNLSERYPARADCSEIVQWGVYQETHGSWIDGSWAQYAGCHHISVSEALRTKGALVFIGSSPGSIHHVGVCAGDGRSVAQARSAHLSPQCGIWSDMTWNYGGTVPVLRY